MKRETNWLMLFAVAAFVAIAAGASHIQDKQIQALTQRVESLEAAQEAPVELSEDPGELPTYPIRGLVR